MRSNFSGHQHVAISTVYLFKSASLLRFMLPRKCSKKLTLFMSQQSNYFTVDRTKNNYKNKIGDGRSVSHFRGRDGNGRNSVFNSRGS